MRCNTAVLPEVRSKESAQLANALLSRGAQAKAGPNLGRIPTGGASTPTAVESGAASVCPGQRPLVGLGGLEPPPSSLSAKCR